MSLGNSEILLGASALGSGRPGGLPSSLTHMVGGDLKPLEPPSLICEMGRRSLSQGTLVKVV